MLRRLFVLTAVALPLVACGGDDTDRVADDRAAQIRAAVEGADLPDDVVDLLQLAARGATATFQVTYGGSDGARLVVSQAPPDRRIDVLAGDTVVESTVLRGGVGYRCSRDSDDAELECERGAGDLAAPGAFTDEAIDEFTAALTDSADLLDVTVEERTIAETRARCLVSTPKGGQTLDPDGPGTDTLCLSDEGAQLLVDSGGERVVAEAYSSKVPGGTFDV